MAVVIETSIGDFTVDLYTKERPKCCMNFLKLCKLKKYTFHLFHTVQTNYVAQSGDPTGTGSGGVSVWGLLDEKCKYFDAELRPTLKHNKKGLISMVNDGNNRHGSQFLITLTDSSDYLDKQNHSVFGEISEGIEVVDKFNETIVDGDDKPYRNIRLFHTVIIDDPFPDPPGLSDLIPDGSPIQSKEQEDTKRVEYDEELDEDEGLTGEQLLEKYKEREAKTNAKLLEILGDIPDADVAPPDNVLFVCKLNPVTTDEDLEIIFSKFGPISSCEIIRDYQTDDSKGYAFIEFENTKDCEKAYLKMDNVLIDDRRIHVDFSQSVSKVAWGRHQGFEYWKERRKRRDGSKPVVEEEPQYNIKDFEKRNTEHYDYVFEEENLLDAGDDGGKKMKKEKKKEKEEEVKEKKKEKKEKKGDKKENHHHHRRHNSSSSSSPSLGNKRLKKYDNGGDDNDAVVAGNVRRIRKRHDTTSSDDDDDHGHDGKKKGVDKREERNKTGRRDDGGGRRDDGGEIRRREDGERRRENDRRGRDEGRRGGRRDEEERNEGRDGKRDKERNERREGRRDGKRSRERDDKEYRKRRSVSGERRDDDGRKRRHR